MSLKARRMRRIDRARFLAPVLANYVSPRHWQRKRKRYVATLMVLALFYGIAFGLTSTYFLLQLSVPMIFLLGALIWLLPETEGAPVHLISKVMFVFLGVLLLWPDYLALSLPGLPWITAVRLVGVPLAFLVLVCLSTSHGMRSELREVLASSKWISRLMIAFAIIATFSVLVSTDISISVSKLIVAAINWFLIFYVAVYVFRTPGALMRLVYMLWVIAICVSLIGFQEWRHSVVPWAGHIPGFLTVQDENVQRILSGAARAATGIYRVQSKFTTSLGLAEFYALVVPFMIHFVFFGERVWIRIAAFMMIPVIFRMIVLTDSRLGMVGFFLACLLYLIIWALWRRRRHRDSAFGPLIVFAYPAIFVAFITATFFVGRLRALIWGTGAQQASTDSRKLQVAMGIPKLVKRLWGYGIGRGAEALGFYNGAGILTIDTYYLAVALEFGVIGFFVYYAIFVIGVWKAARCLPRAITPEEMLLAPLMIALINFLVIKSIFSQLENHPLVFAMLGAVVALCWRIERNWRALGVGRPHNGSERRMRQRTP